MGVKFSPIKFFSKKFRGIEEGACFFGKPFFSKERFVLRKKNRKGGKKKQ